MNPICGKRHGEFQHAPLACLHTHSWQHFTTLRMSRLAVSGWPAGCRHLINIHTRCPGHLQGGA
eukprot:11683630-Alexandrium_andersonii.AAC.1